MEKLTQNASIPDISPAEEEEQIEVSLTWLGMKWADYFSN